jgi:hypothetical protein
VPKDNPATSNQESEIKNALKIVKTSMPFLVKGTENGGYTVVPLRNRKIREIMALLKTWDVSKRMEDFETGNDSTRVVLLFGNGFIIEVSDKNVCRNILKSSEEFILAGFIIGVKQ